MLPQREQGQEDHLATLQIKEPSGPGGGGPGQPACKDFLTDQEAGPGKAPRAHRGVGRMG